MKAEQGIQPTVKDVLRGNTLKVPDGEGGTMSVKVNTLKPSILAPRKSSVVFIGDYNDNDAPTRVRQVLAREIPSRKHRETLPVQVDRYATLAGSYELAELSAHTDYPDETLVYFNIAPRGANKGDQTHQDITWKGEQRQGLIFGITDKSVPIIGVNSGYNFSLVKDHLVGLWDIDFSHDPELQEKLNSTQFRSLNVYPHALAILRGREGRKYIGEKLDPKYAIPDAPQPIIEDGGRSLTTNILYVDGRDNVGGYHNQKLLLTKTELPEPILESERVLVTVNGETESFINTLASQHEKVQTGDFFLTEGSSGKRGHHWLEANQLYGPAADRFGIERVTDDLLIKIQAA